MTTDPDDIFKFIYEERLYKFRCVETLAMNIPWNGFTLAELVKKAEPTAKAKCISFTTAVHPEEMLG